MGIISRNSSSMGTIIPVPPHLGGGKQQHKRAVLLHDKNSLVQIVRQLVSANSSGANVQELLGGAVLVTDCPSWRQEHTSLLTLLRPNASISVTSCCSSLSGFAVNISEPFLHPHSSLRALLAVSIAILGCAVAATIFVYKPLSISY